MMVLTSLGLWLCLTALGEGSEVLGFVWALCSLGKLLDSCWLLSREEKGCGMLKVVSSAVQKFWLLYGQVPQSV